MTSGGDASSATRGRPAWETAGLVFALLLLAGAMLLPWWSLAATSSSGAASFDFGLDSLCLRPSNICTAYGPLGASDPAYQPTASVFSLALVLESIALVATLLAFIAAVFRGRVPAAPAVVALSALVAASASLAGGILVLTSLPAAVSTLPFASTVVGFYGDETGGGVTVTWGGGLGWAMSLVASALLVAAGPGIFMVRRRRREAPPHPPGS